jgi:hypothetical protein
MAEQETTTQTRHLKFGGFSSYWTLLWDAQSVRHLPAPTYAELGPCGVTQNGQIKTISHMHLHERGEGSASPTDVDGASPTDTVPEPSTLLLLRADLIGHEPICQKIKIDHYYATNCGKGAASNHGAFLCGSDSNHSTVIKNSRNLDVRQRGVSGRYRIIDID